MNWILKKVDILGKKIFLQVLQWLDSYNFTEAMSARQRITYSLVSDEIIKVSMFVDHHQKL